MPFSLSDEQLALTEQALNATLPYEYRAAMKADNGGEVSTDEDDWELYPIKDTTDRKRLLRTCNHILNETQSCRRYRHFPQDAVAIAGNGLGDQLILLKASGEFQNTVFLWFHETGDIQALATSFDQLVKL